MRTTVAQTYDFTITTMQIKIAVAHKNRRVGLVTGQLTARDGLRIFLDH